jgi:hypothetical protein
VFHAERLQNGLAFQTAMCLQLPGGNIMGLSDTPRTDAAWEQYALWISYMDKYGHLEGVAEQAPADADPFHVARTLERELAAATARAESAERELRSVKQAEPVVLGGGSGPFPVRVIGPAPVGWVLRRSDVNELQADSINRLIARAKHAHYTNAVVRINGMDEHHEADWIKHIATTPQPAQDGWISVEERLPDVGQEVITWAHDFDNQEWVVSMGQCKLHGPTNQAYLDDYANFNATHWMPLPAAPESK